MEHTQEEENDIEETLEPQSHGGALKREKKKPDATGVSYYGDDFFRYMKIDEYRDLIPAFKDMYYARMIADPTTRITHLLKEFNANLKDTGTGRFFHPYTVQVSNWKKKWDKDILAKKGMMVETVTAKKHVQQVMKTRAGGDNGIVEYVPPAYETLEQGLQTLGGELVNDAMQMMRDDQDLEDIYDSDELIKRKTYIVNVFGHVTKMVHGKAALLLKASQEKRENASFLMDLMKKASSGKMGEAEINTLKSNYQPTTPPMETAHVSRV